MKTSCHSPADHCVCLTGERDTQKKLDKKKKKDKNT